MTHERPTVPKRVFAEFADGEEHREQAEKPESFRSGLYIYARRHDMEAVSFVIWTTMPYPTVVFRLGTGPLEPLEGAPARGRQSHKDFVGG